MTHFEVYLLTKLDALHSFFNFAAIVINFFIIMGLASYLLNCISENIKILKGLVFSAIFLIIFFIIGAVAIPTTKEAAFIYIAPAIINNKEVQKTIEQIPELSSLGMEYLKETLKQEIKEKSK